MIAFDALENPGSLHYEHPCVDDGLASPGERHSLRNLSRVLPKSRERGEMKISVVGLGKLGSPIVAVFAAKGYDVVGIDTNPVFVEKINNHIAPVEEPLLSGALDRP